MAIDPVPSHLPSPVTVDKITAHNAKPRPLNAAESSSSTAGTSGALARLMKTRRLIWPGLCLACRTAVRNENPSSAIATASTTKATIGETSVSGCRTRLMPSTTEKTAPTTNSTTATMNA